MTSLVSRSWDGLLAVLRGTSIAVLAFMMLSVFYDAFMRYAFAAPTSWSLEVNSFLIVYLAVMGAAEAQRHDAHIRITFFTNMMSPRVQALIAAATALLGMVFCGIMTWRGCLMALQAFEYGERVSSSFGTPMVLPYAMLPVGFGALGLQFIPDLVSALGKFANTGHKRALKHG
ncbi:MAG: TRAP transporter small permease [Oceanospirillaceae bacterium]|nr:TRAP transporter small permease [Oceanospirillaceae bacterium]